VGIQQTTAHSGPQAWDLHLATRGGEHVRKRIHAHRGAEGRNWNNEVEFLALTNKGRQSHGPLPRGTRILEMKGGGKGPAGGRLIVVVEETRQLGQGGCS